MDQLAPLLAALAAVIAAGGGLELRHRGRARELVEDRKEAEERADAYGIRASAAEAAAFRRLSLLRRVMVRMIDLKVGDDPIVTDIEKETSQ